MATPGLSSNLSPKPSWGPWNITVDGWFMPDEPGAVFKADKQNRVPVITVANLGELSGRGPIPGGLMIPGYINLLLGVAKAGAKGYAAIFDRVPPNWRREGGVSSHNMELYYVFGEVDDPDPWKVLHFLYAGGGAKSPDPVIADADRKVSEEMMSIWTQFAKTGDPNVKGMLGWPVYDAANDSYMYFADPLQIKSGFSRLP